MRKIALPILGGRFSSHFGGAEGFAVFSVDEAEGRVIEQTDHPAPAHATGSFPRWLASQGVHTIIAAGMGPRAVQMLQASGIEVILGASGDDPEALVREWMEGRLTATGESCHDHGYHHGAGNGHGHGLGGGQHGHGGHH